MAESVQKKTEEKTHYKEKVTVYISEPPKTYSDLNPTTKQLGRAQKGSKKSQQTKKQDEAELSQAQPY